MTNVDSDRARGVRKRRALNANVFGLGLSKYGQVLVRVFLKSKKIFVGRGGAIASGSGICSAQFLRLHGIGTLDPEVCQRTKADWTGFGVALVRAGRVNARRYFDTPISTTVYITFNSTYVGAYYASKFN
jgi:hypothetical protein